MRITNELLKEYKELEKKMKPLKKRIDEIKSSIKEEFPEGGEANTKEYSLEVEIRTQYKMVGRDVITEKFGEDFLNENELITEQKLRVISITKK